MSSIHQVAQRGYHLLRDIINDAQLSTKELAPGEFILRQGEDIVSLYWIPIGEYTMHYSSENGKNFSLGQRFVSDMIIGEIEYLTQTPSQFSVVAHDAMQIKIIPLSMMNNILISHAEVGVWLSQLLSISYQRGMAKTMERFLQPLVFNIVSDLYERHEKKIPLVDFSYVYREAERFGCSERAYRRVISQLVREKYIKKNKHNEYVICDVGKIHQLLLSRTVHYIS